MIAVYEIPWQAIRVSSSFLSLPGPSVQANVIYSVADVMAALVRAPSGGGSRTIGVIDSDTLLGDRRNQVDLRFSKIFRVGGATLDANFDIDNVTNTDAVLGQSATYGTTWLQPTRSCSRGSSSSAFATIFRTRHKSLSGLLQRV
jgi:hypothetical protein